MPVASYAVREGKWIEGAASRDSRQYRTIQSRQAVSHDEFCDLCSTAGSRWQSRLPLFFPHLRFRSRRLANQRAAFCAVG